MMMKNIASKSNLALEMFLFKIRSIITNFKKEQKKIYTNGNFFFKGVWTFERVTEQIGSVSENTFAGPIFTKIISGVFTNKPD